MTTPYVPTAFATPVVNPSVGGSGVALPYLSSSMYQFAPTAMDTSSLVPGGSPAAQAQALADTINRASRWTDNYCFGADPAAKGASLAATLSVESQMVRVKNGELRLVCDYKPILEVVGIDIGADPANASTVGASVASTVRIGRRTIYVPYSSGLLFGRSGDSGGQIPTTGVVGGGYYAVWSYVNGYPHTKLTSDVAAGATSCQVQATDGNGGLYGVYGGVTQLTIIDGTATETVTVSAVTAGTSTATLTTSAFVNAHTVPTAPDFLPVTAIPADVQQAVISMTTMLIKTRGARALVMPQTPGGRVDRQAFAQAGALEDWDIATGILARYAVRLKAKN